MAKQEYPVGDDRNEEREEDLTFDFKLCPHPCRKFGVEVEEICRGGTEESNNDEPILEELSVFSSEGVFVFANNLTLSPIIPPGYYRITFINSVLFNVVGDAPIIGGLRNRFADTGVYMLDAPYKPLEIFRIGKAGFQGTWQAGDSIRFKVDSPQASIGYEQVILDFDICAKRQENYCRGTQYLYTFCLCPLENEDKCQCQYSSELHWQIISNENETFNILWENPESCCLNAVSISSMLRGPVYEEFVGHPSNGTVVRSKPNYPAGLILPEGDVRWDNFTAVKGNYEWICDRLRWRYVPTYVNPDFGGKYYLQQHGTSHGLSPGDLLTMNALLDDEHCPGWRYLGSIFTETIGLVGGRVEEVLNYEEQEYIVNIKNVNIRIKASDRTKYKVGDWVAVQKVDAKPPRGYPTVARWFDEEGELHDPVPYITDQNVPKVDPGSGLVIFISEDTLPAGYYGDNYVGDPYLANFATEDLLNNTVQIISGHAAGQSGIITSVVIDKVYIDGIFTIKPDASSKFRIVSGEVMDESNLVIVPYRFRWV